MKGIAQRCVLVGAVIVVAAGLRLSLLSLRPMHTDEAVHAIKFGRLLEQGIYQYDATEYHGPILNYLTLPVAFIRGQATLKDVDETTLRLVPVLCGMVIVLLPLIWVRVWGWRTTILAMLFTAISPGLTFYSRYYIQETLLVCFSMVLLIGVWRYKERPSFMSALEIGLAAGLTAVTKETCVVVFFAVLCAVVCTRGHSSIEQKKCFPMGKRCVHMIAGFSAALLVCILFYSAFFRYPVGIVGMLKTLPVYIQRAGYGHHIHPWYYYLGLLTWIEFLEWPPWNEDFTVVMAVLVALFVWFRADRQDRRTRLTQFLVVYTFTLLVVYSVIPYKTPWCMLGFLHGMVLLSAVGAAVLLELSLRGWDRVLTWGLIGIFGIISPLVQSYYLNFRYEADPANPYVYAQTSPDIKIIDQAIRRVAQVYTQGKDMYIQVICPNDDYWPLPWTLRDFTRVGYWNTVDVNSPPAELIITQPSLQGALTHYLYDMQPSGQRFLYVPLLEPGTQLRPGVELLAYVRKDLWDKMGVAGD